MLDDIKLTSSDPLGWKKKDQSAFIFSRLGMDCGWCIERGRLVRITGTYDTSMQYWSKRATSVILDSIETLIIDYRCDHEHTLIGLQVQLKIKTGDKPISLEGFAAVPREVL